MKNLSNDGLLCPINLFSPVARPQRAAVAGTSTDSQQQARTIEDQRFNDVIAGLDANHRKIWADWLSDKIACGNDSKTNQGCLKAAAQKRDKQLALNDQLRVKPKPSTPTRSTPYTGIRATSFLRSAEETQPTLLSTELRRRGSGGNSRRNVGRQVKSKWESRQYESRRRGNGTQSGWKQRET